MNQQLICKHHGNSWSTKFGDESVRSVKPPLMELEGNG